jgi:hypothetical protein
MSRLAARGRGSGGDWSLEVERSYCQHGLFGLSLVPPPARFLLSMALTEEEALALMNQGERGVVSFSASSVLGSNWLLLARGIELTQGEVHQIATGMHPRDVLFGTVPACGYRLFAVPDPVLGW